MPFNNTQARLSHLRDAVNAALRQQIAATENPLRCLYEIHVELIGFLENAEVETIEPLVDLQTRAMLTAALSQSVPDTARELRSN